MFDIHVDDNVQLKRITCVLEGGARMSTHVIGVVTYIDERASICLIEYDISGLIFMVRTELSNVQKSYVSLPLT